ncbi:MAG: molybdate ABC transporter permease subunit [Nitriliruptorales bacterium]|nr:molybdate ABC transporter permease subunit [Nitriliruptorales bacterium]
MRSRHTPLPVTALAVAGVVFLGLPLLALLLRTPWDRAAELLGAPAVRDALRISLIASILAVAVAVLLGGPLGYVLARGPRRLRGALRALVLLPLVLPPVVGGVALLLAFGRRGIAGAVIADATGVTLPFSLAGVVMAEAFVALPFVALAVEAGLRRVDPGLEQAAATLGAPPWTRLRRVTLPLAAPALGAGAALAWARALGEFGATITFAGSLPGVTETMPVAVYLELQGDPGAAYVLSILLLAVSVLVLGVTGLRVRAGR